MKVLFITNIPSPYRVLFFNELGKECDLTVIYQKNKSSERNDKWVEKSTDSYKSIFLKGISTGVDNAFCPEIILYLKKLKYDYLFICGISSMTEILAIEWCKLNNQKYIIETDGGFAKAENKLKNKFKKHLIKDADFCFSTGKFNDEYFKTYYTNNKKIIRYPFSSISESEINKEIISKSKQESVRKLLGIEEKNVVLSVGRFSYDDGYGKGYDVLMNAAEKLGSDFGVYIVGDDPTNEFIAWKENKKLNNVHFVGFKSKKELSNYYIAADLFVLMTRGDVWGLVINEAMAFGLPIITTEKCGAGAELVSDGINGFINKAEDIEILTERIKIICNDKALNKRMRENSLYKIRDYTIEKMTISHVNFFKNQVEK